MYYKRGEINYIYDKVLKIKFSFFDTLILCYSFFV